MAPAWTPWTETLVEELTRLWAAGYSATLIAETLGEGITRCAVMGKINRLGLQRRKPPQQRKPYKRTAKRGRPIVRRPVFTVPPPTPPIEPPVPTPVPAREPPQMRKLRLMRLQDDQCRWPIGDPHKRMFCFCAADCRRGEIYCPYHMAKAFKGGGEP